jgi:hypothetical protein
MKEKNSISAFSVIGESASIYYRNFPFIVFLYLLSSLPSALIIIFIRGQGKEFNAAVIAAWIITWIILMASINAIMAAFSYLYNRKDINVLSAMEIGFKRLIRSVVTLFLYTFSIMGGLVLLVIPGLVFAIKYSLTMPAAILEDADVSPFKLSAKLTKGNFMPILISLAIIYIPVFVPSILFYREILTNYKFMFIVMIPGILLGPVMQGIAVLWYEKLKESKKEEIKTENLKGMSTGAGCLVVLLMYILIVAAVAGISVAAYRVPAFQKIMLAFLGRDGKFGNGVKFEPPEGWRLMPAGNERFMIMQAAPCPGMQLVQVYSEPWAGLGFTENDMKPENGKIAEKLCNDEKQRYARYPKLAEKYNKFAFLGSKPVKAGGRGWVAAEFESKDEACAAIKREFWKFYYTMYGADIIVLSYSGTDYTDKDDMDKTAAAEASIMNMLGSAQFPE